MAENWSKLLWFVAFLPFRIVFAVLWCAGCLLMIPLAAVTALLATVPAIALGLVAVCSLIYFVGILLRSIGLV